MLRSSFRLSPTHFCATSLFYSRRRRLRKRNMKLVTFQASTQFGPVRRLGVLERGGVLDLEVAYLAKLVDQGVDQREAQRAAASSLPPEMERFISAGKPALAAAREAIEF